MVFTLLLSLFIATGFAGPPQDNQIPAGQIVEKVVCARDANQSYALYLPANYVSTRKWPVLYAFDPGARGRVPVERFKEAAEKFGWIIVGSNNSRNASYQSSLDSWNAMTRDTAERFSLDDGRAYAAGFSGGARVSLLLASQCKDCLAGVIAGGAGFPEGIEPAPHMRFALFLTAGIDDFNFAEIKLLDEPLNRAGITHRIETHAGRHEWEPASVAVEAVGWMELLAMKSGARERDATFIDGRWTAKLKEAHDLEAARAFYEAYQLYLELSLSFKGLREVAEVESKASELRNSREVREAVRDEQQQIKRQRELEAQIAGLIAAGGRSTAQDTVRDPVSGANDTAFDADTRLHALFRELSRQTKAELDSATRRIARRVLEGQYIGLLERGRDLLQTQKRFDAAARVFTLATEVDPERPGAFYYLAWANILKGGRKKSLKALQTAVDKGFSDVAGLENNKAFDSLRDDPQYQKIVSGLKTRR
jgi:predicted esterase